VSVPHQRGVLVLVGTPIGNLGDVSPRALEALAGADLIACEDTRRTRQLLTHAGIKVGDRLMAVNDHNEAAQVRRVLERLDAGDVVAVVTDAGMPAISDPGERLVAAAGAAGHRVEVVPGPSAAIAALAVSGLPTGRWCFEGFLPRKGHARAQRLAQLAVEERTMVLFEAPHRLGQTLADLAAALGPHRAVAIARELTKVHEEVWRGTVGGAVERWSAGEPRGEFVLVVAGSPPPAAATEAEVDAALRRLLDEGADKRTAIARVAADLEVPKRLVYRIAIGLDAGLDAGPSSPGTRR
jgi:16S rRNA (cytidine1402-2'-O)-methyltransferase